MSWRNAVPFGLATREKPRHFREMFKVAWENKRHPLYAWRILRHGVCDGCSLGPRGLKDDVIPGTHLCLTRLKLLRFNTMAAMPEGAWEDGERLARMSNVELQELGRVPYPLVRRAGEKGFARISWDEAVRLVADAIRDTPPDRQAYFATSRGLTNEAYYAFQKLARVAGRTNNVDLCARLCHAPTVVGLKETIGWGAPTCSLKDFIGTDLLLLFGTDLANNQPVTMKYLHYAKQQGTKVVVVNPVREPGLERYWVPSIPSSAVFGTKILDDFFQVNVGGDVAFIDGVLKALFDMGGQNHAWIREHATGFGELKAHLEDLDWEMLEERSGASREDMKRLARMYADADTAVIVYSMGLTQHSFGTDNVRSIVNLALARGNVGREKTGIMPIRGHSGVQGGGETGVDPAKLPGNLALTPESARRFSELWGADVPAQPGMATADMMEAAHRGEIDFLFSVGGNLLETMPDRNRVKAALERVKLRVHQDIVFNTSTLLEGGTVLVLPAATRYETPGGVTSTSTERRVRFSPEIPGPRIGEAKPEWEIPTLIGRAAGFEKAFAWETTADVRAEMGATMPLYAGIEKLREEGEWLQWGGERLGADGFPNMPDGKARFSVVPVPEPLIPEGMFQLSTRRGKQFNSITYRGQADPLTGSDTRDEVLLGVKDALALGVRTGDRVLVANEVGEFRGRVRLAPIAPRHVQMFWPEANVLIPSRADRESGVPDYNAYVRVEKEA